MKEGWREEWLGEKVKEEDSKGMRKMGHEKVKEEDRKRMRKMGHERKRIECE